MFKVVQTFNNIIEVKLSGIIPAEEFNQFRKEVGVFIKEHGKIRLILDGTEFNDWKDLKAVDTHIEMIKEYHQKIERVAVLVGHMWQHWIARIVNPFIETEVRTFDKDHFDEARQWIKE